MRWSYLLVGLLVLSVTFSQEQLSEERECSLESHEKFSFIFEGQTQYCTKEGGTWAFRPNPFVSGDGYCYFELGEIGQSILNQDDDCCNPDVHYVTNNGACCDSLTVGGDGGDCDCSVEWQYFPANNFPGVINYEAQYVCCEPGVSYVKKNPNHKAPELICADGVIHECSNSIHSQTKIESLTADFSDSFNLNDFLGVDYYCVYKFKSVGSVGGVNVWQFNTNPNADLRMVYQYSSSDGYCYVDDSDLDSDLDCCSLSGHEYSIDKGCCDDSDDAWRLISDSFYGKPSLLFSNDLGFYCDQGSIELPDETQRACESVGGDWITQNEIETFLGRATSTDVAVLGLVFKSSLRSIDNVPFCCHPYDQYTLMTADGDVIGFCDNGVFTTGCTTDDDCERAVTDLCAGGAAIYGCGISEGDDNLFSPGEQGVCRLEGDMTTFFCNYDKDGDGDLDGDGVGICDEGFGTRDCVVGQCGADCCPESVGTDCPLTGEISVQNAGDCTGAESCVGSYNREVVKTWACQSKGGPYSCYPGDTDIIIGCCGAECYTETETHTNYIPGTAVSLGTTTDTTLYGCGAPGDEGSWWRSGTNIWGSNPPYNYGGSPRYYDGYAVKCKPDYTCELEFDYMRKERVSDSGDDLLCDCNTGFPHYSFCRLDVNSGASADYDCKRDQCYKLYDNCETKTCYDYVYKTHDKRTTESRYGCPVCYNNANKGGTACYDVCLPCGDDWDSYGYPPDWYSGVWMVCYDKVNPYTCNDYCGPFDIVPCSSGKTCKPVNPDSSTYCCKDLYDCTITDYGIKRSIGYTGDCDVSGGYCYLESGEY